VLSFGQFETGVVEVNSRQRLLVDGVVFVRFDRKERLALGDEIAILEVDGFEKTEHAGPHFHRFGGLGFSRVFVRVDGLLRDHCGHGHFRDRLLGGGGGCALAADARGQNRQKRRCNCAPCFYGFVIAWRGH